MQIIFRIWAQDDTANSRWFAIEPTYSNGHINYINSSFQGNWSYLNELETFRQQIAADFEHFENVDSEVTDRGLNNTIFYGLPLYTAYFTANIKESDQIDYTQVLNNINTNLTNLNEKFIFRDNSNNVVKALYKILSCLTSGYSTIDNWDRSNNGSYILKIFNCLKNIISVTSGVTSNQDTVASSVVAEGSFFRGIVNRLQQSVSPKSNITDVLTSIHNDLTNINTTENNKDTVLIIDGQQEFKLRNKDEMSF